MYSRFSEACFWSKVSDYIPVLVIGWAADAASQVRAVFCGIRRTISALVVEEVVVFARITTVRWHLNRTCFQHPKAEHQPYHERMNPSHSEFKFNHKFIESEKESPGKKVFTPCYVGEFQSPPCQYLLLATIPNDSLFALYNYGQAVQGFLLISSSVKVLWQFLKSVSSRYPGHE